MVQEWTDASEAELIAHCRSRLAHFKAPSSVVHLAAGLPKTSTGKVQKFSLREVAREAAAAAAAPQVVRPCSAAS